MKIEIKNLSKNFGDKNALNQINLTIEPNKIIGLLGRNGAGKTTLLQLLAGHTKPSKGEIVINGEHPFNQSHVLEKICLISEANNFKRKLKIREILKMISRFYPNWSQQTADQIVRSF